MTINRFRGERMRLVLEDIFTQVIELLADKGLVTLETYFFDGTKIEANANKYTFVWKRLHKATRAGCVRKCTDTSRRWTGSLPRMQRYEMQMELFQERRSFSKTDMDVTFMRMKEDHMGNG